MKKEQIISLKYEQIHGIINTGLPRIYFLLHIIFIN